MNIMNLFSVSIYFFILLPRLLSFGMFLDGSIYSSIARNMAEGKGTFWAPYYGGMTGSVFYWHPPLAFKIHSFFYMAFGDYPVIDTLYGLLAGLLMIFLIFKIHKELDLGQSAWLSVILFSVTPMVSWTLSNNMLEITMLVFILLSVYVQIRLLKSNSQWVYAGFFLTGGFLSLAILSKNIAGTFPLILPGLFMIFRERKFKASYTIYSLIQATGMAFILWAAIGLTGGSEFYQTYLNRQVVASIEGSMPGENISMLQKFLKLGSEIIIPLLVCLIAVFSSNRKFTQKIRTESVIMLILGLSAIVPLFLVAKFRTFYMFPGLVFFAIGMGMHFSETAEFIGGKIETYLKKIAYSLTAVFMIGAVIMMFAGSKKSTRKVAWEKEIYRTNPAIPPGSKIFYCNDKILKDYTILAYMQRYFKLTPGPANSEYLFFDSKSPCDIPSQCREITPASNKRYHIYNCTGE